MTRPIILSTLSVVLLLAFTALEAQPSDSLMVHLEFEGNVLDSSSNMYETTSTVSFVPGIVGMAATFSGSEKFIFQTSRTATFRQAISR